MDVFDTTENFNNQFFTTLDIASISSFLNPTEEVTIGHVFCKEPNIVAVEHEMLQFMDILMTCNPPLIGDFFRHPFRRRLITSCKNFQRVNMVGDFLLNSIYAGRSSTFAFADIL